jgi:hypothetical protein
MCVVCIVWFRRHELCIDYYLLNIYDMVQPVLLVRYSSDKRPHFKMIDSN